MVFSGFTFLLLFLPLFFTVYYIVPVRLRNGVLFVGSLIFYAWGEPIYVLLLLFSTLVDYVHGILADRWRGSRKSTLTLVSSICMNVGLLVIFKYSALLINTFCALTGSSPDFFAPALPVGISFYTFQTMSYTIDVYRGKTPVQKNLLDFGTYVSMFPQLIAGPIVRYASVQTELHERYADSGQIFAGIRRFLLGLGKKVLLANSFGNLWELCSTRAEISAVGGWVGIAAFALQIYYDFSGYSDMAIGLGRMLGFHFPENFDYPYCSRSITEFWRRWHMTLGSWFKEYVYIPLGGSRRGRLIQLRNILIVWGLTGIWHGASWNFLLWGLYFAVLLILEKCFLYEKLNKGPAWAAHLYTLVAVAFGWVLFSFEKLSDGICYFAGMLGLLPGSCAADAFALYQLRSCGILFLLGILGCTPVLKKCAVRLKPLETRKWFCWLETAGLLLLFLLCLSFLAAESYNPFLYFRF